MMTIAFCIVSIIDIFLIMYYFASEEEIEFMKSKKNREEVDEVTYNGIKFDNKGRMITWDF